MPSGGSRIGSGRPRLTAEEKAARGTLRPHRERAYAAKDEAAANAAPRCPVPPAPDDLDTLERECWDYLAEHVDAMGSYAEPDEPAFRNLVVTYAMQEADRRCRMALRKLEDGEADEGGRKVRGELMTVPERLSCARTVASLLATFGVTPIARGKVAASARAAEETGPKAKDPDDFAPLPGLRAVP